LNTSIPHPSGALLLGAEDFRLLDGAATGLFQHVGFRSSQPCRLCKSALHLSHMVLLLYKMMVSVSVSACLICLDFAGFDDGGFGDDFEPASDAIGSSTPWNADAPALNNRQSVCEFWMHRLSCDRLLVLKVM
jgi:hypothetical protein